VQTAVIAFGKVALAGAGELGIMPSAREKQNLGGLDSMSSKLGTAVLQASLDALRSAYGKQGEAAGGVLDDFRRLRFDLQEVEDRWWTEGASESPEQLQARAAEFVAQLLYSPHRVVVVVGHSHFFRAVFRDHISSVFRAESPRLARELSEGKLSNCGIARVDLEMSPSGISNGVIRSVQLVLGSTIEADRAHGLAACCACAGQPAMSDRITRDEDQAYQIGGTTSDSIEGATVL
jgi:hypothetical protein